jgi:hypothetical protein
MYALKRIMKAYEKEKEFTFSERALEIVTIFKLEVTDFTGKRHQR